MKSTKITLALVISILAALGYGFISFLGANFLHVGVVKVLGLPHLYGCIVLALLNAFLLFFIIFFARWLKKNKSTSSSFRMEMFLVLTFLVVAGYFSLVDSYYTHYFTVTSNKTEITQKIQLGLVQAEKMFVEYEIYAEERVQGYKLQLQTAAESRNPEQYVKFGLEYGGEITVEQQIEIKLKNLRRELFPTNYTNPVEKNGMKEVATKWVQDAKKIMEDWKPIGIAEVVNDIETQTIAWQQKLVSLSQAESLGEEPQAFIYSVGLSDAKKLLTRKGAPTAFSAATSLILFFLIMLYWIATPANSRASGLRGLSIKKASKKRL